MDQLVKLMSGLEVRDLDNSKVEDSVLQALEEVGRHQRRLMDVLERLERRKNRKDVLRLLENDQDQQEGEQPPPFTNINQCRPLSCQKCFFYQLFFVGMITENICDNLIHRIISGD